MIPLVPVLQYHYPSSIEESSKHAIVHYYMLTSCCSRYSLGLFQVTSPSSQSEGGRVTPSGSSNSTPLALPPPPPFPLPPLPPPAISYEQETSHDTGTRHCYLPAISQLLILLHSILARFSNSLHYFQLLPGYREHTRHDWTLQQHMRLTPSPKKIAPSLCRCSAMQSCREAWPCLPGAGCHDNR